MAFVELNLQLRCDLDRAAPEVRAFVDVEPDGIRTRETELALTRCSPSDWRGSFVIGEHSSRCFLYRVGLVAHAGAEWWLTLRGREDKRPLLADHDTLAMAKGWLVGTCELAGAPLRIDTTHSPREAIVVPLRRVRL